MDKNKKFNQIAYNNAYNKAHYTNCSLRIKPDKARKIADYCKSKGYSKNDFYVSAAMYIIDNNIQLPTNTDKSANSED